MIMSEWYEDLTDEQIEWLKSNRAANCLLVQDEFELLASVPQKDRQYFKSRRHGWKIDDLWEIHATNGGRDCSVAFRLRPDWERPKKTRWVFEDVPLDEYGYFRTDKSRYHWTHDWIKSLRGFAGIIFEWRGYRLLRDVLGLLSSIDGDGIKAVAEWSRWNENPSVEPPRAVGVRFRRGVENE
jgi:hypothetical protein